MTLLEAFDRAPGLRLGKGVELPEDVELGAHVTIHAGVRVCPGCVIGDHVVLGGTEEVTILSDGVTVCAHAVVDGAVIEAGSIVGDQARLIGTTVGENTVVGRGARVGTGFLGDRVRLQTNLVLGNGVYLEDDVFMGPGSRAGEAVHVGPAARVGAAAMLEPEIVVGEEAFLAAGAHVDGDVPPRAVMIGRPARHVRDVPDADLIERWR